MLQLNPQRIEGFQPRGVVITPMTDKQMITGDYLQAVRFDPLTVPKGNASQIHERDVVIYDILQSNSFKLQNGIGPYNLLIRLQEMRLVLEVNGVHSPDALCSTLSWSALRRFFRDYEKVCGVYHSSIKSRPPTEIESIDMARRSLHNDGATYISEHLKPHIDIDFETARALYSLFYTLYWKG